MQLRRVVVTGLGAVTPLGNAVATFWANLATGVSGAGHISRFETEGFATTFACEVKDFDGEAHLGRKEARRTDLFSQYALAAVGEALADAGLDLDKADRDRIGVIWASALGGIGTAEEQIGRYAQDARPDRFSPFYIPKMLPDASSGLIALHHDLHGVNFNTVSACASANAALVDAANYIRLGKADVIISGGSEAPITPTMLGGFGAAKALSTRNSDPQGASRPFDSQRDGFVLAEGAGALILEEYGHALQREAHIYGELLGGGISADAYHATAAHPQGRGALLSMRDALNDASLQPQDVDYVNAHATSTPLGDISEVVALRTLFGSDLARVRVSSTKSMTGHLLGAAGAVEAIVCLLALRDALIPPTINVDTVDPEIRDGLNLVLDSASRSPLHVAMSNSFGFGGHNATVIFGHPAAV